MKKELKTLVAALCVCGVVSAYAVCYKGTEQYCVMPDTVVGSYTYSPGEPCYPGMTPIKSYANPDMQQHPVVCDTTWQGYPQIPNNRQPAYCWANVYYIDCFDVERQLFWDRVFSYYQCVQGCTP